MDGITYSNIMSALAPAVVTAKADTPPVVSEPARTHPVTAPAAVSTYATVIRKEKYKLSFKEEQILKAVDKANKAIMGPPKKFEYSVHKATGEIVIKVVNSDTNEVLKELPPEKLLDIVGRIAETAGAIIDEKR